jgi:hypothetical protein
MCRLKEFLETTQDRIEQLFGRRRLAHLPHHGNYGENLLVFAREVASCPTGFKYQPQWQSETKS